MSTHSGFRRLLLVSLGTTLILITVSSLANAASAYIRVNQVGYIGSGTKRAYLMAAARKPARRLR